MRAINLIPPEQRRGAGGIAGRTGGIVYVIIAALVALVGFGVLYVSAVHQVAKRKTTLAQVTAQANAVNSQVAALQPYVQFESISKQRVASVVSLAEQRFDWPDAMEQLALSLPPGVTLSSLTGSATGGAAAGATGASGTTGTTGASGPSRLTVNAPTLAINGCAPSQDAVAETLTRLRELRNVQSATVSTYSRGGSCIAFTMTAIYANTYAIPSTTLQPGSDSTVGG